MVYILYSLNQVESIDKSKYKSYSSLFKCFLIRWRSVPGWPDASVKKIAQNVAQSIFCHFDTKLPLWKRVAQSFDLLINSKKLPKVNNCPNVLNRPNLVTLLSSLGFAISLTGFVASLKLIGSDWARVWMRPPRTPEAIESDHRREGQQQVASTMYTLAVAAWLSGVTSVSGTKEE
jgi:hypothetical protein